MGRLIITRLGWALLVWVAVAAITFAIATTGIYPTQG